MEVRGRGRGREGEGRKGSVLELRNNKDAGRDRWAREVGGYL